jgi:hypothetical protein
VLIPLIAAVLAVFLNQFFFESNRKVEARIQYESELFRKQTPVHNRILAFTYKYEVTVAQFVSIPVKVTEYIDSLTGKTIRTEKKEMMNLSDTLSFTVPSIVIKLDKREQFLEDLDWIKNNRDILDHDLFIQFDKLLEFLSDHPLPTKLDQESISSSDWVNKKTQKEWNSVIQDLRNMCFTKIYGFYLNE